MTTKRTPKSRGLGYWWNEFLFAREFAYETEQTPQDIAESLAQLQGIRHKSVVLGNRQNTFQRTDHSDKVVDFTLVSDRISWGSSTGTTIQTQGTITADPDTGMTIVEGRVRFAPITPIILAAMIVLAIFVSGGIAVESIFWLGLIVASWWYLYRDRNSVADEIDKLMMSTKSRAASQRLQDDLADEAAISEHDLVDKRTQYTYE